MLGILMLKKNRKITNKKYPKGEIL